MRVLTPPVIHEPRQIQRAARLTYTATKASQALTSGAPPIDPETGRQFPILKLWAVQQPSNTTNSQIVFPAPFPTGKTYTYVGGIVYVEVSMTDGGTDQRFVQVGVRPTYLRVGKYMGVSVKSTVYMAGTLFAPDPGGPIYAMWCREANVPQEIPLPRYPDLSYAAGTSANQIVPTGAVRFMSDTATTITWKTAAGPNNPAVIAVYPQPVAAWTWVPVLGDVYQIEGPCNLFIELDPL